MAITWLYFGIFKVEVSLSGEQPEGSTYKGTLENEAQAGDMYLRVRFLLAWKRDRVLYDNYLTLHGAPE